MTSEFSLPASLLVGCVETGGVAEWDEGRIVFLPGDGGEAVIVAAGKIAEMRLGGRRGADANRMDLALLDGRRLTLLVVGRDRLVARILDARGWEHAANPSGV